MLKIEIIALADYLRILDYLMECFFIIQNYNYFNRPIYILWTLSSCHPAPLLFSLRVTVLKKKWSYQQSRSILISPCLKCLLKFAFTPLMVMKILFRSFYFCEQILAFSKANIRNITLHQAWFSSKK